MAGIAKAEFVGPTNAQLAQTASTDFNKTMQGMADFFANMATQKQAQESAKIKAQQEQDKQDVTSTQSVLDTMVKNSATGSLSEVLKTPEGQQIAASLYGKMGISKDVIPAVISQLANNPYTAEQTHQAIMSQYTAEQVAAAQGQAAGSSPAAAPAPAQAAAAPAVSPGPGAPPQAASAAPVHPVAQGPTPEPMPATGAPSFPPYASYPSYMQEALSPEHSVPAPTSVPSSPQEQAKISVQTSQAVKSDAQTQAKTIAQDSPSAAAIFLKKQLDPNSVEFLTAYAAKNPSEYYKDTDPKHVEAFQANIDKTLAERKKLGLEADEISVNLETLSAKNKGVITYTKALTLQALMAASTAQVNAKLSSAAYQTNNAVLTKLLASAQDREDEANKMYAATTAKGAKATVADVAHLNSLVEQANSYYKQANRVVTTMHVSLGGAPKEAPQFSDVPSYIMSKDGGLVGGFSNAWTSAMQGEGSQTGQVTRGAMAPQGAAPAPSTGVGAPQQTGTGGGVVGKTTVPSGFTPDQQKMADDILKELGK